MKKVVCISNDLKLNHFIEDYFYANHIRAITIEDPESANHALSLDPDILLIDLTPTKEQINFSLARQIREISDKPILFTSSGKNKDTMTNAISFSFADYIRKPFDMCEMAARMNKLLTLMVKYNNIFKLNLGEASMSLCDQSIEYQGNCIHFSTLETKILYRLYQYRNEYIDRNTLICKIWGSNEYKLLKGSFSNILWKIRNKIKCIKGVSIDTQVYNKIKLITPE